MGTVVDAVKHQVKKLVHRSLTISSQTRNDLDLAYWDMTRHNGDIYLHGVKLRDLAANHDHPLHILNTKRLVDNVQSCQRAGDDESYPVDLFFSYKTAVVPGALRMIHDAGAGAEVISGYEFWLARQLGVPPSRIIYNGPAKSMESLDEAIRLGVLAININHAEELAQVRDSARRVGVPANVGVRVALPSTVGGQFGISSIPTTGQDHGALSTTVETAMQCPDLNLVAIHFHRGKVYDRREDWVKCLNELLLLITNLQQKTGFIPAIIDLGGGMPIPTTRPLSSQDTRRSFSFALEPHAPDPLQAPPLEFFARTAGTMIKHWYETRGWPRPKIILESGRGIIGNAQLLITRVLSIKHGSHHEPFDYAILDAGISVASILTSEFHQIFRLQEAAEKVEDKPSRTYRLVGPICHIGDTLFPAWRFPSLKAGDLLAIMDSGAYFISDSRTFSFGRPGVVAISPDGQTKELRRHESYEDIIALDRW